MKSVLAGLILILTIAGSGAWAHSGRTDKNGCHHDKSTKTKHCH